MQQLESRARAEVTARIIQQKRQSQKSKHKQAEKQQNAKPQFKQAKPSSLEH